jgi:hypothetical protein
MDGVIFTTKYSIVKVTKGVRLGLPAESRSVDQNKRTSFSSEFYLPTANRW